MGGKAKIVPSSPAVIGAQNYKGVIRTDFAAKSIVSRQLRWSGASAAAHDIDEIEGASVTKIGNLQLHFSWNMGYVGGIARAGGKLMQYENRPRYLYVVSSPLEVEFEMEKSSFKELAIEFDQSFLLRSCEAVEPAATEIPDTWDYDDPLCWELANALHSECMAGAPNGSIYGETVMTLLALQTMKELALRDRSPNFYARGGLPPTVLRRSCEYMIHHLSADVSPRRNGRGHWSVARPFCLCFQEVYGNRASRLASPAKNREGEETTARSQPGH